MKYIVFEVYGDLACFSRPETKVERLSYPIITPSAARGILDAIYVKPIEFGWRIDKIELLNPISYIALRRNEIKEKVSSAAVFKTMRCSSSAPVILADATADITGSDMKGRTQRQTIALQNARYRITAHINPRKGHENRLTAFEQQALRRIEGGKCYYQPCFGCREFIAYFGPPSNSLPLPLTLDLGYMLYDVFDLNEIIIDHARPFITLFKAQMKDGVLDIPDYNSELVIKPDIEAD